MLKNSRIIVVGATGRVGREMLSVLSEFGVPSVNVSAAASERSAGMTLEYGEAGIRVQNLADVDFSRYDLAL
ncbi:MAG: aspartate-semialdehyde dehydrogenase, partial [Alphaproteobacteria bacterium]|nr:aspartate-semialdehyde dehydrogenase [Alphaproteobacteria bacterium]